MSKVSKVSPTVHTKFPVISEGFIAFYPIEQGKQVNMSGDFLIKPKGDLKNLPSKLKCCGDLYEVFQRFIHVQQMADGEYATLVLATCQLFQNANIYSGYLRFHMATFLTYPGKNNIEATYCNLLRKFMNIDVVMDTACLELNVMAEFTDNKTREIEQELEEIAFEMEHWEDHYGDSRYILTPEDRKDSYYDDMGHPLDDMEFVELKKKKELKLISDDCLNWSGFFDRIILACETAKDEIAKATKNAKPAIVGKAKPVITVVAKPTIVVKAKPVLCNIAAKSAIVDKAKKC
jgi:hypothetical protein